MRCDGAVLRAWRRSRGWDAPELARRLRKAADGASLPEPESLKRMIWRWERGGLSAERYELLYARALDIEPDELAGGPPGMAVSGREPGTGDGSNEDSGAGAGQVSRPTLLREHSRGGETGMNGVASSSLFKTVTARPAPSDNGRASPGSDVIDGLILGAVPPDSLEIPVSALVQASMADATKITTSAGRELIDPLAIEQFFDEVRRLAITYNASTAGIDGYILKRATELRGTLKALTAAYREPSQSADLFLMIGLLSAICSQACLDLGYPDEAMAQARASFMMGELVGHDGLRAWVLGTRSLIARFEGRYDEALSYARRGLQYATGGTAMVRLRCGEGQTLAHIGDAVSAIDALNRAKDARENVSSADVVNGLFTFSEAKQTYYSGSSLQWLSGEKNAKAAEAESVRAIEMFQEANPGSSSGDELLAHVYLGNSRLTLGEIEGSMEALRPVLDLPVPERNAWQRKRMRQVASRLQKASFADSRLAISARDEISSFVEAPKH